MSVLPPFGVPEVVVRLVRKRFTLSWPWMWGRKRRLKRELERQLQLRAEAIRLEAWKALRDAGFV